VRCDEIDVIIKPFIFCSLGNFKEDAAIMKRRKRGCKPSDCVRWLKGAISFDVMKTGFGIGIVCAATMKFSLRRN
jgi:hypothetical protein